MDHFLPVKESLLGCLCFVLSDGHFHPSGQYSTNSPASVCASPVSGLVQQDSRTQAAVWSTTLFWISYALPNLGSFSHRAAPVAPASPPDAVRQSQPGPASRFRCRWGILKGLLSSNGAALELNHPHFWPLVPVRKKRDPAFRRASFLVDPHRAPLRVDSKFWSLRSSGAFSVVML